MSKMSCFRPPFHTHRVYGFQTLLESARQLFYSSVSSPSDRLSCRTSLIVRSDILRLFDHTFNANDKCSRYNRGNFPEPIQIQLPKKPNTFFNFSLHIWKLNQFLKVFRKRKASELQYFWNYRLWNTCLLKCLKGFVLENPFKFNALPCPKLCWNLQDSPSILLCHHLQKDWVEKRLSYSALKSWEWMYSCGIPVVMKSIPVIIGRISRINSNAVFLKTENIFWIFYCISEIFIKLWTFRKKHKS